MHKVLFITNHYLYENNGGSNCSKAYLNSFAKIYGDLSVIYPEKDGRSDAFIPSGVKKYPCHDRRSNIRKGLDIYRGYINRYEKFIPEHLREHSYDIIVIDHTVVACGTIRPIMESGAKIITIHHNVERDYVKDNLPSISYRLPYVYYMGKAERDSLQCSCLNLCLTQHDCDVFRKWYPSRDLHLHCAGVFEYAPMPADVVDYPRDGQKMFVISGSLYFKQSNAPIIDFISRYYPVVRECLPEWKLKITGRNPSDELKRVCGDAIMLVPNPEDITREVAAGSVYLCPIYAGSGLKLRIMDGLRSGLPVLCHENASSGYEAIKEAGYLFDYHDEKSFRESLLRISEAGFDRQDIYEAFKSYFSMEAGTDRLRTILGEEKLI